MATKRKFDWLHVAISWGASIVIIGALFKILHIGGVWGNYMIGIGLGVEAFLFFLTGFFAPSADPDWEKVLPATSVSSYPSSTAALDKMLTDAKIGPELIESLANSLRTFGDKVAAISNIADSSTTYHDQVNALAKNLSALNAVYELELQDSSAHLKSMSKFYQNLSSTMHNFNESAEDSKQFKEEVGKLAKNLASLNIMYGNMLSAMNQPRL